MPTQESGQHEDRTRVIGHLPLNNSAEEKAVKNIIDYVEAQRRNRIGIEGYTYSAASAFYGRWWSSEARGWMEDKIILLIVDYKIPLTDKRFSLSEKVAELQRVIHESYDRYGRPQEEVWVVAHPVIRHT